MLGISLGYLDRIKFGSNEVVGGGGGGLSGGSFENTRYDLEDGSKEIYEP